MKRPLRERVWFWKPQWYWFGWKTLLPIRRVNGDEWDWHTIVLGWTITGRMIIATRRCPQTGRCANIEDLAPDWPWRTCYGGSCDAGHQGVCRYQALPNSDYCALHTKD